MDWDKVLTITTIWGIVGITAFFAEWYTVIPATIAFIGTVEIAQA